MNGVSEFVILGVIVVGFAAVLRHRRRFGSALTTTSQVVLPLVALPTVVGISVFTASGAVLLLGVLACLSAVSGGPRPGRPPHLMLVVALALALLLPASRYLTPTVVQVWHVAAFFVLFLCATRFPFAAVVLSLLDGVGAYLILNVVAHFAGIVSPAAAGRAFSLESSTGGLRVFFPLTGSLAVPPLMAAVFVAAGLICLEGGRMRRLFRMAAFSAAVFVMLEANTRAALVVAVLVLVASVAAPRLFARVAIPVAAIPILLPVAYPFVSSAIIQPLVQFATSLFPFLSRGNTATDVTIEGRSDIWSGALTFWAGNVDWTHRLIGYGEFGQQRSGASFAYSPPLQYGQQNSLVAGFSTHNSTLQQLFDGGLLGMLALVIAVLGSVAILARGVLLSSSVHLVALSALVAGFLGGATEVTQAPGFASETFWVLVGLVLAVAVGCREDETEQTPPVKAPSATWSAGSAPSPSV